MFKKLKKLRCEEDRQRDKKDRYVSLVASKPEDDVDPLALERAVKVLSDGMIVDESECVMLVKALGSKSDWAHALTLLGGLRRAGGRPGIIASNSVANACSRANLWQLTMEQSNVLRLSGIEPNHITRGGEFFAIRAASRNSDCVWRHALVGLVASAEINMCMSTRPPPNFFSLVSEEGDVLLGDKAGGDVRVYGAAQFGAAIAACGAAQQWRQVVMLFSWMQTCGLLPNVKDYTSAILAYARGGHPDQIDALVTQANGRRLELDDQVCRATIEACKQAKLWQQAVSLIEDMYATGVPTADCFGKAITACTAAGICDPAVALLEKAEKLGFAKDLDMYVYAQLRTALLAASKWELGLNVWRRGMAAGLRPDSMSYTMAARAFAHLGRWREGMALLREAQRLGLEVSSATLAVTLALQEGENGIGWPQMLQSLSDLRACGMEMTTNFSTQAISSMSSAADGNSGVWKRAFSTLLDMRRGSIQVNAMTLVSAIGACGDRWPLALEYLEQAKNGNCANTIVYNAAIHACHLGTQGEIAKNVFKDMRSSQVVPDMASYNSVIAACSKDESIPFSQIWLLVDELSHARLQPNASTFNSAICACERRQHWECALFVFSEMQEQKISPTLPTFGALISACRHSTHWPLAISLLSAMETCCLKPDLVAVNAAISACETGGHWELAVQLLLNIRQRGMEPDIISYNAAISACENAGQWQWALWLLQDLKGAGLDPDIVTYTSVIAACAMGKQWAWAVNILEEMKHRGIVPSVEALNAAIRACTLCKQCEYAEYLFSDMQHRKLEPDQISYSARIDTHSVSRGGTRMQLEEDSLKEDWFEEDSFEEFDAKIVTLEEVAKIYKQATAVGAFVPWTVEWDRGRKCGVLDLHGMNTEVAKVAVFCALEDLRESIPESTQERSFDGKHLRVVVGKGIHAKSKVPTIGPKVHKMIRNVFNLKTYYNEKKGSFIITPGQLARWSRMLEGRAARTSGQRQPQDLSAS